MSFGGENIISNYLGKINSLMPGARVIKLTGYSKDNKEYQKAKTPVGSWKNDKTLNENQICNWISQGGWIGCVIPKDIFLVDIDDSSNGELLRNLLEGENIHHNSIKTPNGWQFIFKAETSLTLKQGQYQNYVNRLGLAQDTRAAEKGYIVFPTENTEGRQIVSQSFERLDELPQFLYKVWNGQKTPSPMSYPYDGSGSRDGDFYDLARRLMTCRVSKKNTLDSLQLAYEYFVPFKDDFPSSSIDEKVESAYKKIAEVNTESHQLEIEEVETVVESYPTEVIIPAPFFISNGALFKKEIKKDAEIKKMVSRKTPLIKKELHNIERTQVLYEIEWNEATGNVNEIVSASTIATRKDLLELSEKGFSVNENNVKTIIEYLDLYLSINEIERQYAVERLGNIKGKFIHPLLAENIEIMTLDHGEKSLLEGFEVKGTSEAWKTEVFERLQTSPKAVLFVLASFASVIIRDLKIDPFIVDLSGNTSQGKTTTLKAAASVWGNEKLMNEWNATKVSIERKASYLNDFPLLMDDTRKADERLLKDVIYQFSGGRSKGRGSLIGSQREFTWNNILLSTGEVTLNEYSRNAGGAAARIIPIVDEPLKKDHENIMQLHIAMENNYGAIGIDFLKIWLDKRKELTPEYHTFKKHYLKKSKNNNVLNRIASYYSAIHFTGSILNRFLGFQIKLVELDALFDLMAQENKSTDKPIQFLEEILTELDSNRQTVFYDKGHSPNVINAIYKGRQKTLHLTPAFLSKFLGLENNQIRKEWLKRGITLGQTSKNGTVDYKGLKHEGTTYRVISLNMDFVESLGFDFDYIKPKHT